MRPLRSQKQHTDVGYVLRRVAELSSEIEARPKTLEMCVKLAMTR
jgi:hypothetical protein